MISIAVDLDGACGLKFVLSYVRVCISEIEEASRVTSRGYQTH